MLSGPVHQLTVALFSTLMAEESEQHASDGDNLENTKSNNNNNQPITIKPVPAGMMNLLFT